MVLTTRCGGCTVSNVASRETFFELFRGQLRARAQKALGGSRAYEWPFVRGRPLDDVVSDEFAEFAAGFLARPTPRSAPEPWFVQGVLRRGPSGPAIVSKLTIEHFPVRARAVPAEITGGVLRDLQLGTIRDQALRDLEPTATGRAAMAQVGGWHVSGKDVEVARRAADEASKSRRGRPGYPSEHYRRIALRYLELIERHRNVLVVLAAEESERAGRTIPRETVRDWVRKATERGYLAPGKPGRAEARPGSNLYRKEK
jgi:hypothetical protein